MIKIGVSESKVATSVLEKPAYVQVGNDDIINAKAPLMPPLKADTGHTIIINKGGGGGGAVDIEDGQATIATQNEKIVTIKREIIQQDGTIKNAPKSDITLAAIATTGSVEDLVFPGGYFILNCGTSTTVV